MSQLREKKIKKLESLKLEKEMYQQKTEDVKAHMKKAKGLIKSKTELDNAAKKAKSAEIKDLLNAQLDQERDAALRNMVYKPITDSYDEEIGQVQAILDGLEQKKSDCQEKITALAQLRDGSEKEVLEQRIKCL